jgi:hypothetical protein
MTELDLLNLGRATTANEIAMFTQIITITITFAMIVAIYYFLHRASLAMKIFAFVAYSFGFFLFFGEMLIEGNIKVMVMRVLHGLPQPSAVTQEYLGVSESWLGHLTSALFNISIWILWLGVFFLLFFGRKHLAKDSTGE